MTESGSIIAVTDISVEVESCGSHVGSYPKVQDTAGEQTKKSPADKAAVQTEEFPLVSFHQIP